MPADGTICRTIVRRHARTFHLASAFLTAEKRRAAYALYAFCRVVDDQADATHAATVRRAALARHERLLRRALDGHGADAVYRELAWAVERYAIPADPLLELLAGVARDTEPAAYASWPELARYCEGVASSVGEMCAHVFGVAGSDGTRVRALRYARTLGVAMQLTNILRDVGEDATRGRCYLPAEDLAAFGLGREMVLDPTTRAMLARDERWRPFMAYEIGRARMLYEAALPGIALLAADARRCATACALGYAGILDAIERVGYDTLSLRARPTTRERLAVLWRALRPAGGTGSAVGPIIADLSSLPLPLPVPLALALPDDLVTTR